MAKINGRSRSLAALLGAGAWFQPRWPARTCGGTSRRAARSGSGTRFLRRTTSRSPSRASPWMHHEWLWGAWLLARVPDRARRGRVGESRDCCSRSSPSRSGSPWRHVGSLFAAGAALWAAAATSYWFLDIRPHEVTLLFVGIVLATREQRWARWLWAPLMVLWCNTHGGFVFGLRRDRPASPSCRPPKLPSPRAGSRSTGRSGSAWPSRCSPSSPTRGACASSSTRSPISSRLAVPRDPRVAEPAVRARPARLRGPLLPALVRRLRRRGARAARPLPRRARGRRAVLRRARGGDDRHGDHLAPLHPAVRDHLAAARRAARRRARGARRAPAAGARAPSAVPALALVAALLLWRDVQLYPSPLSRWTEFHLYPRAALRYLQALAPGPRVLNYYNWGGYMMLHAPEFKLLIDGRANTLYDERVYKDYLAFLGPSEGLPARLALYAPDVALIPAGSLARTLTSARVRLDAPLRRRGRRDRRAAGLAACCAGPTLAPTRWSATTRSSCSPAPRSSTTATAPPRPVPLIERALALDPLLSRGYGDLAESAARGARPARDRRGDPARHRRRLALRPGPVPVRVAGLRARGRAGRSRSTPCGAPFRAARSRVPRRSSATSSACRRPSPPVDSIAAAVTWRPLALE